MDGNASFDYRTHPPAGIERPSDARPGVDGIIGSRFVPCP